MPYLPPDAPWRLREYVYQGEDRSYIYRHFWRPLCQYVVQYLPVWLAPNVITVSALAFVAFTHTLLIYYIPKLTVCGSGSINRSETMGKPFALEYLPPPPVYVFVLVAFALLLYQLLDNLDGHQARRTGTSSPLGLLMDHGCDAVNCIIGSLSIAATISAGPCWKSWVVVLNTVIVFFMNTWEEYYRGELILPVVNGPNEGILMAIAACLWTAWVGGPQWWYNNAVEVPSSKLPQVLRQSAPLAAAQAESIFLRAVCPLITFGNGDEGGFAGIPFFFNLNCSDAYISSPTLPVLVDIVEGVKYGAPSHPTALNASGHAHVGGNVGSSLVIGKRWWARSFVQRSVLALYGNSEETIRIRYHTLIIAFMTSSAFFTCVGNVYQVYKALRLKAHTAEAASFGSGWLHRHFPFLHALTKITPLLVLTVMSQVWYLSSSDNIFRRHPRVFCWTVGLLYTKMSIHLMLAHLLGMEFQSLRRTFVPFMLFGLHILMGYALRVRKQREGLVPHANTPDEQVDLIASLGINEELILYEFFAFSLVTFAHLVWNVMRETAAALEVPIFTVPKERQVALRQQIEAEKRAKTKGEGRKSSSLSPSHHTQKKTHRNAPVGTETVKKR